MGDLGDQIKKMNEKFEKKGQSVEMNLRRAVTNGALRIERTAKLLMKNTQRGEPVRRGKRFHAPSVPGAAPAPDTGRLIQSITHTVAEDGKSSRVGTAVVYGKMLEYGTSRMAPRPWLRPSVEQNRAKIVEDFKKCLVQPEIEVIEPEQTP